jgi:hypothetical protein
MDGVDPILQLTAIIQDIGIWAVFMYLFINERASHTATIGRHIDDLREIAGIKARLEKID